MGLDFIRELKANANEPKSKKTYVIPKVSKKRAKLIEQQKDMQKLDKEFYREHWLAAPHRCENCGCSLGKEPLPFMFHHLLPKSKYPQFRHTHENIMLLCLEDHSKAETNIHFAPKIKQRTLEAEKLLLSLPTTL